jgi:drug/metabolite transporter (DMT)-like permease
LTLLFAITVGQEVSLAPLLGSLLAVAGIVLVFGQAARRTYPSILLAILLGGVCSAASGVLIKSFPKPSYHDQCVGMPPAR